MSNDNIALHLLRFQNLKIRAAKKDATITDDELAEFSDLETQEIYLSNVFGTNYRNKTIPSSSPSPITYKTFIGETFSPNGQKILNQYQNGKNTIILNSVR